MKIRMEPVTNSSSCSFVVIGMYVDPEDVAIEKLEYLKDKGMPGDPSIEQIKQYFGDYIDELISGTDLSYSHGDPNSWGDNFMIGIKYENMEDDETLGEFKAKTKQQIKESLGIDKNVGHIEACWEDR